MYYYEKGGESVICATHYPHFFARVRRGAAGGTRYGARRLRKTHDILLSFLSDSKSAMILSGAGIAGIVLLLPVQTDSSERSRIMKGYMTAEGYMGYVGGRYILFVSESEYLDYMEEKETA